MQLPMGRLENPGGIVRMCHALPTDIKLALCLPFGRLSKVKLGRWVGVKLLFDTYVRGMRHARCRYARRCLTGQGARSCMNG
jgi:hypothetical protein